ncbi:MAG: L-rhamnonate dehydratase [Chloroflexi bacterium]|nr:L-rhamnonate dehydratase [Chloroflexota bacterium]
MKIKSVATLLVDITPRPRTSPRAPRLDAGRFVSPSWRYAELRPNGAHQLTPRRWLRLLCLVTAEDGTRGVGMTIHGDPVQHIIEDQFAPLLIGQDAMATEKLWDMMNRTALPYSSGGLASYAISAVDTALWDLKGKLLGRPVYELLGGPQKERIFCYASNTDLSYGLEASLSWFLELGFKAVKIFAAHGPWEGIEGLRKEEERVARAREIVGDDVELAFDCWMSFDIDYAVRLAEVLRPYRLKWIEDILNPEDHEGYRHLRQRLPYQPLATGEHWYTPFPFARAAAERLLDILQPDVLWAGGISGCLRICHLAEAFGLSVITHGGMNFPYGQHLAFAMPTIPWGERSETVAAPGVPLEEMVHLPGTPVIREGYLVPSDAPGFGLEIDERWLEKVAL